MSLDKAPTRPQLSGWRVIAGLSGALAVGLSAWGAHAFQPEDPKYMEMFERANKYHFFHTFVLAMAPTFRRPNIVCTLFMAGILMFSGSLYVLSMSEGRHPVGSIPPWGGMSFIAGWLALALTM